MFIFASQNCTDNTKKECKEHKSAKTKMKIQDMTVGKIQQQNLKVQKWM